MEKFQIRENGFQQVKKNLLIRIIPLIVLSITGALFISNYKSTNSDTLLFLIPFILILTVTGIYTTIRKQEKIFNSFTLSIDEQSISKEQFNSPNLVIAFHEIKEIYKKSNGNLVIKGKSFLDMIEIPFQIENIERLENILNNVKPIIIKNNESVFQKYGQYLSLLVMPVFGLFYISDNKYIIGISGLALIITLVCSIFIIQKNKNIDNRTKRVSWITLFVLLAIILRIYYFVIK